MTVSSTAPKVSYKTSGSVTTFGVPFEFIAPTDLNVRLYADFANDPDTYTVLRYGNDYSVSGGNGYNGSITLLAVPTPAQDLVIQSAIVYGQTVAYVDHGPFPAKATERALDRLAIQIKQLAGVIFGPAGSNIGTVLSVYGRSGHVTAIEADYDQFYSLVAHTHTWAQILGKPAVFPPDVHTHDWAQITGKPTSFPPSGHSHAWGEITSKPLVFPPDVHTHVQADITDLDVYSKSETDAIFSTVTRPKLGQLPDVSIPAPLAGEVLTYDDVTKMWIAAFPPGAGPGGAVDSFNGRSGVVMPLANDYTWTQIAGKPSTFAPSAHTHPQSEVVNLVTDLAGKAATVHTHTWSQITDPPATFAPSAHTHPASQISDASVVGRTLLTAADAVAQRAALDVDELGMVSGFAAKTANFDFALTDRGKVVEANAAGDIIGTVRLNATVAFPINTRIDLAQYGAGHLTIAAEVGVTIHSKGGLLKLTGVYSGATLIKRSTNEWYLIGDLA
jgi:hypothetical protein